MRTLATVLLALLVALPAGAVELSLDGKLIQGGMVVGRTAPGAEVRLDGKKLRVNGDGIFVLGFGRDAAPHAELEVKGPDGSRTARDLDIEARHYRIQRVEGLPPRQVTPGKVDLRRIRAEGARITKARAAYTPTPRFLSGFMWPAHGPISGVYGSQRILNGKPRQPHLGVDVAAPKGTPVVAAAAGTVTLADPDLFFTGGTVIIDHGLGVSTVYAHLSRVDVAVGDRLDRGQTFGAVGATGRVTGPHLHWSINLYQQRLDPALVVGEMPKE